jgi:hypothetical protein
MPSLTIRQLIQKLTMTDTGGLRGSNFIHVVATSSASSVRKNGVLADIPVVNPHYKKLIHFYGINAMTGFKYQKRLDKLRDKAGLEQREAEAPVNGHEKIAPQIVRQKNGNIGLACEVLAWLPNECRYENTVTGMNVTKEELAPFLPKNDRDVDYLTPNLCNLASVTIDGQTYDIDASDYADVMASLSDTLPMLDAEPAKV